MTAICVHKGQENFVHLFERAIVVPSIGKQLKPDVVFSLTCITHLMEIKKDFSQ